MESYDTKNEKNGKVSDMSTSDVDKLLEEREKLDTLFKEKFTRTITVMFTDLKGSTAITDLQGDFASRALIKKTNDIIFPIIKKNNGALVKTMGDGTMSYFERAQDALSAAVQIQSNANEYNIVEKPVTPILVRMGLHTGTGIVEKDDIFGDVVNVASRFEQEANPGEVYISEDTYNSLTDKAEIYSRFIKTTRLKGKKEAYKVYKVFWKKEEVEADKSRASATTEVETEKRFPLVARVLLLAAISIFIVFMVMKKTGLLKPSAEKRAIHHAVDIPDLEDKEKLDENKEKPTFDK